MKKEIKKKVKKFLEDRKLARNPKDIALIILEGREIPKKAWQTLNLPISYFLLDNPLEFQKVRDGIIRAQKEGKIFLMEIKCDPNSWVVQLLREISHFGRFNIHDEKGNLVNNFKVEPGSLAVVAQRKLIREKITYPYFYNIFDTALLI